MPTLDHGKCSPGEILSPLKLSRNTSPWSLGSLQNADKQLEKCIDVVFELVQFTEAEKVL